MHLGNLKQIALLHFACYRCRIAKPGHIIYRRGLIGRELPEIPRCREKAWTAFGFEINIEAVIIVREGNWLPAIIHTHHGKILRTPVDKIITKGSAKARSTLTNTKKQAVTAVNTYHIRIVHSAFHPMPNKG